MAQRILIIEDTLTYQQALKRVLAEKGYDVTCASSGEAGLEAVNKHTPDLIILDLLLPGIDGREVCRRLKMNINLRPVPVMMLTMKDEDRAVAEGFEAGADTYVNKNEPLDQIVHRAVAFLNSAKNADTSVGEAGQDLLKGKKVLIVDDDITYLQACKRFFREKGYVIATAMSGVECLEKIAGDVPDLILLDLRMPETDGVEVCRRLRQIPGCEVLPVVMLTASDSAGDVTRGFEAGISDYVVKSGEFGLVELRVHALIRRKHFEDETRKVRLRLAEAEAETHIARAEQAAAEIRIQAEKRLSHMKDEFLANMSHELRTPLNAIIGFSEILHDELFGAVNEKQRDYLADILSSGKHLLSLINDILDLSKIEAGRMSPNLTRFSVEDLLQEALVFIRERAMKRGIELKTDIAADVGEITADERMMKQVVINLLSNAIKFTPEGGKIGITARKKDRDMLISVWDTGIGIAPQDQDRIFQEFVQLENAYTKTQKGTGLGLSLTKKMVELHEGKIWIESAGKDKGSSFFFTVPSDPQIEVAHG